MDIGWDDDTDIANANDSFFCCRSSIFQSLDHLWIICYNWFAVCQMKFSWGEKFVWIGSSHAHRIKHTKCHTHIYLMEMTTMKIWLMPHVSNWDDRALAHQLMRKSNSIISQRSKVTRTMWFSHTHARDWERERMKSKPNCSSEQERIYEREKKSYNNSLVQRVNEKNWNATTHRYTIKNDVHIENQTGNSRQNIKKEKNARKRNIHTEWRART